MKIIENPHKLQATNYCVTVGTFDGVHQGHNDVLNQLRAISDQTKLPSMVFTFKQHPRIMLNKDPGNIWILNTVEEKANILAKKGIDILYIKDFDAAFAGMGAQTFIEQMLFKQIGMRHLIMGHDHAFGRDRNGDRIMLQSLSKSLGFGLYEIEPKNDDGNIISSTKIRDALMNGEIEKANKWLGYPYFFSGKVVGGRQIGRSIGFPTANIEISNSVKLIPQSGVYVVRIEMQNQAVHFGMMNIGKRPTFGPDTTHIEVHIFDFNEDLYNIVIEISVLKKMRSEMKFDGVESLVKQLELDKLNSLSYLATL